MKVIDFLKWKRRRKPVRYMIMRIALRDMAMILADPALGNAHGHPVYVYDGMEYPVFWPCPTVRTHQDGNGNWYFEIR